MNEERDVSRAGEKTLGIIGIVFNILIIALLIFTILGLGNVENDPGFRQMLEEQIVADPTLSDMGDTQAIIDGLLTSFDVVMWTLVALLTISTILALFAVARLGHNRKPKMAGGLFIVAGIFAGLLSLTSILFYIAAIMCLVRKPRNGHGKHDDDKHHDDKHRHDNDRLRDKDSVRHEEERLRENERMREEEQRRLEEQRLKEENHKLEDERHRLEQQRLREQDQHAGNDNLVERDDLKRRADVRQRKDGDNRPL